MGTNTLKHAEFKSEEFPHRRPAVCSQTAILSSPISRQFLHFVVSLQNRFHALALISVFDMNIHSATLRLFKIGPVVSLLPATHRQYLMLLLSLPLRRLLVTFVLNTLISSKLFSGQ